MACQSVTGLLGRDWFPSPSPGLGPWIPSTQSGLTCNSSGPAVESWKKNASPLGGAPGVWETNCRMLRMY